MENINSIPGLIYNGAQRGFEGEIIFNLFTINTPGQPGNGATFSAPPDASETEILKIRDSVILRFL